MEFYMTKSPPNFLILSLISTILIVSACTTTTTSDSIPSSVPTSSTIIKVNPPKVDSEKIYKQGIELYKKEYFLQAAQKFREAAKQDHAEAQFKLARMYFDGKGVTKDLSQTTKWYRKAAKLGHLEAQFQLAGVYRFGIGGVSKDLAKATQWYQKAAEQGSIEAQLSLGVMYYKGTEINKDLQQAKKWLSLAAKQGNEDAVSVLEQVNLELGE
jgi:TPR repeat protein